MYVCSGQRALLQDDPLYSHIPTPKCMSVVLTTTNVYYSHFMPTPTNHYSTLSLPSCTFAATYDVQEPHAELSNDGRKIDVNGELIGNSSAKGCFVAIQCNFSTPITFIALKRNGENQRLSGAISMPASNYTVYVHDLEKDGLPNIHPANLVPSSVEITHGEEKCKFLWVQSVVHLFVFISNFKDKAPNIESVNNASISRNGSILEVNCTPDKQSASCVLVYRAYGNYMLNREETFPVTVDLDPDMNYTFALFRRLDKDTDERPFVSMFVQGTEDPSQPPSTGKLI